MSIVRLPFSLFLVWAATTIATPPQPPPHSEERVDFDIGPIETSVRLTSIKACFCLAGFGEALLTFASIYPSSPWSKSIAAFLIDSHPVSLNIRLTWSFIAAWIFAIAGAIIRRRCYQVMGEMFTFELSLRNHHKLVTWGPYAVVRHPSYTGVAMALIGGSICYSTPGSWTFENSHSPWARFILILCWVVTTVAGIFVVRRANTEDKMLQKQFGTEWESWAKQVPCRLIPGVY